MDRHDNNPKDRDEQRAWYETIRDFAPIILNLKPTMRLFAKDYKWCDLNPENKNHIEEFKAMLGG